MKALYKFFRSTVIGGLLVLVPLALLIVIAVKTIEVIHGFIEPLLAFLPNKSVGGVSLAFSMACLVLLLVCFLAGLVAQLALTRRLIEMIESLILARMPGYSLMKNVGESLAGIDAENGRKTVLAQVADSWQIGFLMDELPDGRKVVFVPDVPNAMTGTLHMLTPERIEIVELSIHAALDTLGRLGVGLGKRWPIQDAAARETR